MKRDESFRKLFDDIIRFVNMDVYDRRFTRLSQAIPRRIAELGISFNGGSDHRELHRETRDYLERLSGSFDGKICDLTFSIKGDNVAVDIMGDQRGYAHILVFLVFHLGIHVKRCPGCGKLFSYKRSGAIACGNTCRVRIKRQKLANK